MPEEYYDHHFPNLRRIGFQRTSEPAYYNCIAYAAGDFQRRWWPGEYHPDWSDDYWPPNAPSNESLEAFASALATVGYSRCPDDRLNAGFEKVALYAKDGAITHAAVQQEDGAWRSKLGADEDIEHSLEALTGPLYGAVIAYFSRPRRNYSRPSQPATHGKRVVEQIREALHRLFSLLFGGRQ
jgi:hypothetical protein